MMDDERNNESSAIKPIIRVIGLVALGTVIVCGACFASIFGVLNILLAPAAESVTTFMEAVRDDNYDIAFQQLTTDLQAQVEDAQRLRSLVIEYSAEPESWSFTSQSVENNFGRFSGQATLKNGEQVDITIRLHQVDDKWQIMAFEWDNLLSRNF